MNTWVRGVGGHQGSIHRWRLSHGQVQGAPGRSHVSRIFGGGSDAPQAEGLPVFPELVPSSSRATKGPTGGEQRSAAPKLPSQGRWGVRGARASRKPWKGWDRPGPRAGPRNTGLRPLRPPQGPLQAASWGKGPDTPVCNPRG